MKNRVDLQRTHMNTKLGLEEPYPSPPSRPSRYCLYVTRRGNFIGAITFYATYAAQHFLNEMTRDDELKWLSDDTVTIGDTGVKVKADNLEDLVEYKMKPKEKEWQLTEPYLSWARFFVTGEKPKIEIPTKSNETKSDNTKIKEPRAEKKSGPRPDGLISLGDICTELKLDPREARVILRKKSTKPDHGWAWSKDEVSKIKQLLGGKDETKAPTKAKAKSAGNRVDNRERKNAGNKGRNKS